MVLNVRIAASYLAVLLGVSLLALVYLSQQDKVNGLVLTAPRFSSNMFSTLSTNNYDENITGIPSQISNKSVWSIDQMWGCYVPSSHKKLLLGRTLRSHSTLDSLHCRKRVPDVALIGVKKCGSQTLTGFLDLHPEIVGIYEGGEKQSCVVNDRKGWLRYSPYSTAAEKSVVDVIKIADCQDRVKWIVEEINPAMKFLVIIRDPYKRAVSDYKHLVDREKSLKGRLPRKEITVIGENGTKHRELVSVYEGYNIPSKFEYAVLDSNSGNISKEHLYIYKGIYVNFIKQVIETVSRQNLLVIDGEVFAKDPYLVLKNVERFLGLNSFFQREDFQKNSKGYFCPVIKQRPDSGCIPYKAVGKNPAVSESLQKKLKDFYRPYNRELFELLQQTFEWS